MKKTYKERAEELKEKSSDNYKTPEWIKSIFYPFYDPCPFNPHPSVNGLKVDWKKQGDRAFVNPPYSNPLPWVEKSIEENKKGMEIILLLKLDCSTKWYRLLHEANAHFLFINERVKFNGKAPPFPNVIIILEAIKQAENILK